MEQSQHVAISIPQGIHTRTVTYLILCIQGFNTMNTKACHRTNGCSSVMVQSYLGNACGESWSRHPSATLTKDTYSFHVPPNKSGLWTWYTKPPTPQFLNLQLQLLHKGSIYIHNGKVTKHYSHTTWLNASLNVRKCEATGHFTWLRRC
jgi:hypothetical protein